MIVETDCPFCGKTIRALEDSGTVTHALPACREFASSVDSLEFLVKVNNARGARRD